MPLEAWAFAFASAAVFGLAHVLTQLGLRHTTPALGVVVSIPTAATLFWLSAPFTADLSGWRTDAALLFAAVGLVYPVAVTILTFEANRLMGPHVAGALGNLGPLIAVIAGLALLGEVLALRQLTGVAIVVGGVTCLSATRQWRDTSWPGSALALPLTASLIRGLGPAALKVGFMWWPNPRVATLACYLSSAIVAISVGLWRTRGTGTWFTRAGVAWFMLIGICNGFATWSWIESLARGPVALVAPVVATYPLFTMLFGRLLIGRLEANAMQAAGVGLTVVGIGLLLTS